MTVALDSPYSVVRLLFKGGSVYALRPLLTIVMSMFMVPLYTAYLTTEDYGNLAYILLFGQLALTAIRLGQGAAFWKFRSSRGGYSRGQVARHVFLTQLFTGIAVLMIGILVKVTCAGGSVIATLIVVLLLTQTVSVALMNILLILRANFRAKFYILVVSSHALLSVALNVVFVAVLRLNYRGIVFSSLLSTVVISVAFCYILRREFEGGFDSDLARSMIRYGLPIAVGNMGAFVLSLSDRLFLKAYATSGELGLYSFGYKFGDLVRGLVIVPFFMAWNPIRWQVYQMENGKSIFARFNRMFLVVLPAMALFVVAGAIVLGKALTMNEEYVAGFRITIIIAISHVMYGLYYFNSMGMLFENKTKVIMYIILSSAAANLVLNQLLIPPYGMLGASIATAASYLLMLLLGRHFGQRYYPIERSRMFEVAQCGLLLAYGIGLTFFWFRFEDVYAMALAACFAGLFHLAVSFTFSSSCRAELRTFLRRLRSRARAADNS